MSVEQDMKKSSILRISISAAGWALFCFAWWKVTRPDHVARGAFQLTGIQIVTCMAAIAFIASLWILHNLRISRKGFRRSAACVLPRYDADCLGRKLVLPATAILARAAVISVRLEGGRKLYEAETGDQSSEIAEVLEGASR
jgi:hypothetical protein